MTREVYDRQGNLLDTYDPDLGRLVYAVKPMEHPAVEGVEEEWHWETVAEYPNGGRDVKKVIDVPGVMAQDAWVEEVPIRVYIPYTPEELAAIEAERNKPDPEERIAQLEEALNLLLSGVTE